MTLSFGNLNCKRVMRILMLFFFMDLCIGSDRNANFQAYLEARQNDSMLCLYTFDEVLDGGIIPSRIEDKCPFGPLKYDMEYVKPINATNTTIAALAIRGGSQNTSNPKDTQLRSMDIAASNEFYSWAIGHGMSFEMALRIRKDTMPAGKQNEAMNLFSIASDYDECTNPGIRVLLNEHNLLVLIFSTR